MKSRACSKLFHTAIKLIKNKNQGILRMRITKLVVTLSALLIMAGCTNTYRGAVYNVRDNFHWLKGEPSDMEKKWGPVPTGYAGQNPHPPILKPKPRDLVWNEVGTYDSAPPPIGSEQGNVTVYPVDGDSGYPQETVYVDYGQLIQQLYFEHGSSLIGSADKSALVAFGKSIKNSQNNVALTVVGHASMRVDGVQDPVRRKTVNFEMAQKRANAVTMALRKAGVTPGWIEAISRGDDDATGNETSDRRADLYMR